MVVSETEVIANREIESTMQTADQQQPKHNAAVPAAAAATAGEGHTFSSLRRQASIYTLTLDEFQHALCESGKNFGSMNMDEFLVSVWNAEENQQAAANSHGASVNGNNAAAFAAAAAAGQVEGGVGDSTDGAIARQTSLPRQGSLTLPPPLCRKTVDEVWLEIHRGQLGNNGDFDDGNSNNSAQNAESAPRQPTFGEMTLEDFLIKAGVVREQHPPHLKPLTVKPPAAQQPPVAQQPQVQSHYGVFQGTSGPSFAPQSVTVGDARTGVYPQVPPTQPTVCYSGRVPNGGGNGGYSGPGQPFGVVGPLSPVSPDGLGHGQVDSEGGQFGIDMGGLRGRKRIVDGPVEKAVERRQRRMIKNRESAARSRARKQAYTVELEAELNQLKEENAQLKQTLAELERKRKQQHFEDMKTKPQSKAQKVKEKLRRMRRNNSCPLL